VQDYYSAAHTARSRARTHTRACLNSHCCASPKGRACRSIERRALSCCNNDGLREQSSLCAIPVTTLPLLLGCVLCSRSSASPHAASVLPKREARSRPAYSRLRISSRPGILFPDFVRFASRDQRVDGQIRATDADTFPVHRRGYRLHLSSENRIGMSDIRVSNGAKTAATDERRFVPSERATVKVSRGGSARYRDREWFPTRIACA